MRYILALDQGTTSSRAILFDREGNVCHVAQREFRQIFPQSGWVEHDPLEIWQSQSEVAQQVLSSAQVSAADVGAIGITNQRETTVVWNRKTGEPIHNAIVWQDRRTATLCQQLSAGGHAQRIRKKTGLVVDAYFSGTKIAWILDNVAGARELAEGGDLAFGNIDTWLVFKLSAGQLHLTDPSNASRTMLFDIQRGQWDDDLLKTLRVPRTMLPEVRSSSEVYGTATVPSELAGIPIAGIVGDQQAALMGQLCTNPGMAKNTYGTGCFLLMNTGPSATASSSGLLTTVGWKLENELQYALEGSVFIGGAVVQWLRDGLKIIDSAADVETLAASVPDNGDVFLVPALAGLGSPHWDPYARGTIVGISRGTTSAHIARAALEGIAFQVADLVSAMENDAELPLSELRVDGGAAANNLLLQSQADLLQKPVVRPTVLETTALGAAYAAGLAVGFWPSLEQIRENWQIDRRFEPAISEDQAQQMRTRWRNAVNRSKAWVQPEA